MKTCATKQRATKGVRFPTLTALAVALGVNKSTVSRWINGGIDWPVKTSPPWSHQEFMKVRDWSSEFCPQVRNRSIQLLRAMRLRCETSLETGGDLSDEWTDEQWIELMREPFAPTE